MRERARAWRLTLRSVFVFLASAFAGALIGAFLGDRLAGSMMASTRQQNPQYTGEGLEYVVIAVTFAGTACGAVLGLTYLAVRARRRRRPGGS